MSSITISPATPTDVPTLSLVAQAAFKNDKLSQAGLAPNMTPSQHAEYNTWRNNLTMKKMSSENKHYFKAVSSDTGELVGIIGMNGPTKAAAEEEEDRYPNMPDFLDKKFYDSLAEGFKSAKQRVMGSRRDYWCSLAPSPIHLLLLTCCTVIFAMFVHPSFQGQGIASKLLQHGLSTLVDRDGLDCYLEASADPWAMKLYQRNGFEKVLEFPMLDDTYLISAMVRKAKTKTNGVN